MKKRISIVIATALLLASIFLLIFSGPPSDVEQSSVSTITGNVVASGLSGTEIEINKEKSMFEFEGFAPGKSHVGLFEDYSVSLFKNDNKITGFKGVIQANSVNTGIGRLDTHLKSDDFFDTEANPEISFVSTNIEDGQVTGELTLHGITNEVSFPAEVFEDKVRADFLLDTTPFNIKYVAIDKDVRISFEFSA